MLEPQFTPWPYCGEWGQPDITLQPQDASHFGPSVHTALAPDSIWLGFMRAVASHHRRACSSSRTYPQERYACRIQESVQTRLDWEH